MRNWINLIEGPSVEIPDVIYHGTSDISWREIQKTNCMVQMEIDGRGYESDGICFTTDFEVAKWFAAESVQRDQDDDAEHGVVISFDARKMAHLGIAPYRDPRIHHSRDEKEVRIPGLKQIDDILQYVLGAEVVADAKPFSARNDLTETLHSLMEEGYPILAAATKLIRDQNAPNFRGNCEGAAGDLAIMLIKRGIPAKAIEGVVEYPTTLGSEHWPASPHCWVDTEDYILDPTVEQFGVNHLVISKNTAEAAKYHPSGELDLSDDLAETIVEQDNREDNLTNNWATRKELNQVEKISEDGAKSVWIWSASGRTVFYVLEGDQPVGYLPTSAHGKNVQINSAFVTASRRQSGLGYYLYTTLLDHGYVLTSDFERTPEAMALWNKLERDTRYNVQNRKGGMSRAKLVESAGPIDVEALIDRAGFTDHDRDSATSGFCGMFALALYRVLFDYKPKLILVGAARDGKICRTENGELYWHHAAIELDGRYYDVEGEQQAEWMINNYVWGMPFKDYEGVLVPVDYETFIKEMRLTKGAVDWRFLAKTKSMLAAAMDQNQI